MIPSFITRIRVEGSRLMMNMLHEAPCKQEEFIPRPHPGATGDMHRCRTAAFEKLY
jgi:hypothetical protein